MLIEYFQMSRKQRRRDFLKQFEIIKILHNNKLYYNKSEQKYYLEKLEENSKFGVFLNYRPGCCDSADTYLVTSYDPITFWTYCKLWWKLKPSRTCVC